MNHSPELENIIEKAIQFAKDRKHTYVTVEHLLLGLITFSPFKKCLESFGTEIDMMIQDVSSYLDAQKSIEAPVTSTEEIQPRKTNSL